MKWVDLQFLPPVAKRVRTLRVQRSRTVPQINREDPPYLQVARHFREKIQSGVLADGDMLPSARTIARDWDITVATASKALGQLRSEGLVRGEPGRGTIVQTRSGLHHSAHDRAISIDRTGKIYPPGHYARIHSAELTACPEHVADALSIAPGAPVIRRRRTTYNAEGDALSTSVSWFDGSLARIAPRLVEAERIPAGTPGYITEMTGRVVAATHVQHAAGAASEDTAAQLRITPGSPVLLSRNRFIDQHGDVIEYGESTALAEHWVFYEYSTKGTE
ncbi:GntR family transcriptional regulator [Saccharopolyspora sp. K220]|uniref:GntR family transcriptional regulator n=1 Tax=Saccharopolyspora soli TaxID=2926618 RepID=UPI001F59069B|nr:GntR family transcriptional regulator [Saccharopolyspora soli]MCI2424310.1 GntR family transcriptional regulator [Saccharopolyspora soli]